MHVRHPVAILALVLACKADTPRHTGVARQICCGHEGAGNRKEAARKGSLEA